MSSNLKAGSKPVLPRKSPPRTAMQVPAPEGRRFWNALVVRLKRFVEELHRPRGVVRVVQRTGEVVPAAPELAHEPLQKVPVEPGVGVEKYNDVPARPPAARVPADGHGGRAVQDLYEREAVGHGDRGVLRARVHDEDLIRRPALGGQVREQAPEETLLVQGRDNDADRARGAVFLCGFPSSLRTVHGGAG